MRALRWVLALIFVLALGLASIWNFRDDSGGDAAPAPPDPAKTLVPPPAPPVIGAPAVTSDGRLAPAYPGNAAYLERERQRAIQMDTLRSELRKAEALWLARRPHSYEFTVGNVSYRVDGDRSVPTQFLPGTVPGSGPQSFDTIDHVFARLKQYLKGNPFQADIHFHPDYGFPVSGGFKAYDNEMLDDAWGFELTEFKVIDHQ